MKGRKQVEYIVRAIFSLKLGRHKREREREREGNILDWKLEEERNTMFAIEFLM